MLNTLPKENEMLFGTTTQCMLKNQALQNPKTFSLQTGKLTPKRNPLPYVQTLESNHALPLQTRHHSSRRISRTQRPRKHKTLHTAREKPIQKPVKRPIHNKIAHNVEDACKLIEVGFKFITGEYQDGGKIFRKRK
jgi:hypothetical protein